MPATSPPVNVLARTPALRLLTSAVAALLLALAASPATASAARAPSAVKKSKIVAPTAGSVVTGTLSQKNRRCRTRFRVRTKSVRVYVTGPLHASRAKTTRLKSRGGKTVRCTWSTRKFKDGRYRLTVKAKARASGKWWNVRMRRIVRVRNTAGSGATVDAPQLGVGNARFVARLESQWDPWITAAGASRRSWMNEHFWGVVGHSTFFDSSLSWAPPAIAYKDLYAIYREETATIAQHPDWILRDAAGNPMSIPWGCQPGPCPQFAGDIGNPAFRAAWIAEARQLINAGYKGLWIDDANMEMRVGNAAGVEMPPVDPRTGKLMTFADWRRYMAEFLEEIRRQLPGAQLVANALWFGGTAIGRDADPFIQRAYTAVDRLNLERGFNDDGLTNGTAPRDIWSVDAFMAFIDRMHDRGIPVTLDSAGAGQAAWEYNLAGFFLVDRGEDAVGEMQLAPGQWWGGWDVELGAARESRKRLSNGVYRRTFRDGVVYLNPPRDETRTIRLGKTYRRIDGSPVRTLTLPSGAGAVLRD